MTNARPLAGASAIALAIVFNIPYAVLAATYDYPDVLRRPAGEALDLFAAGGAQLILTWHGFALSALALAPLAIALALTPARVAEKPALAIGAAIMERSRDWRRRLDYGAGFLSSPALRAHMQTLLLARREAFSRTRL